MSVVPSVPELVDALGQPLRREEYASTTSNATPASPITFANLDSVREMQIDCVIATAGSILAPDGIRLETWRDVMSDSIIVRATAADGYRSERPITRTFMARDDAPLDVVVDTVRAVVRDVVGCQEHDDCRESVALGRACAKGR